jgi:hypothetical protein
MYRVEKVKALPDYKLWLKFSDGVEGTVDLSGLVGKGVFSVWRDKKKFAAVYVDPESHTAAWPGGIDLCPDNLYMEITGKEVFSLPEEIPSASRKR